jgi:hypothetical protein
MSHRLNISVLLAGVMLVVHPAVSRSADKKEVALKIVKQSIKFLGGEENLKKYKGATFVDKGIFYGMGEGLPYTGKHAVEYARKFRMEIVGIFTQIYNGDKGWVIVGGAVTEMTVDQLKAIRDQYFVEKILLLYPLLDKKHSLELLGDGNVSDQGVAFIKVSSKGQQDVTLAINPKTGALVKAEYKGPIEGMPDKIVTYEVYFDEYKIAGKIKYASKFRTTRAGEKFLESTISEYKPVEKLDQSLFAKPK